MNNVNNNKFQRPLDTGVHLRPNGHRDTERAGANGVAELPEAVVADAGYWNEQHIDEVVANKHIPVLIPPDKVSRGTPRSTWSGGRYDWMRKVLATELGRLTYRKRKQTIEPIFGDTKHNCGVTHFNRRGRVKVRTEWRLLMMAQNLAKVYRHQLAARGA